MREVLFDLHKCSSDEFSSLVTDTSVKFCGLAKTNFRISKILFFSVRDQHKCQAITFNTINIYYIIELIFDINSFTHIILQPHRCICLQPIKF